MIWNTVCVYYVTVTKCLRMDNLYKKLYLVYSFGSPRVWHWYQFGSGMVLKVGVISTEGTNADLKEATE